MFPSEEMHDALLEARKENGIKISLAKQCQAE